MFRFLSGNRNKIKNAPLPVSTQKKGTQVYGTNMKTIAIANQKGGCGKTTTSVNLAAAFNTLGKRVLIIDLDPQAHTTLGFGYDPDQIDKTIYDTLTKAEIPVSRVQLPISRTIINTNMEGLHLAPSNILLSGIEFELATVYGREYVLKQQLETISDNYDICVIDCSPSLSLLTLNALTASTDLVIPVQAQYYAIEGLKQLLETVDIVNERFNPNLKILGVLLTFVESRTLLSKEIQQQMRDFFGELVFDTVIHRTTRLAEAPSAGESILAYAPKSKGATEYISLAEEILNDKISYKETSSAKVLAEQISS